MAIKALLTGAIVGGGAMYFFDPRMGNRRRALLEDSLRRMSRETVEGLDVAWRDLSNRASGTMAQPGVHAFTKWTPGTRLLAGAAGGLLMANCLVRRNLSSVVWGALGFGLANRALSGACSSGACRMGEMDGGVTLEKMIEIKAPAEDVFDFFTTPENFQKISSKVTSVRRLGNDCFAKEMVLAGVPLHFEERYTRKEPGRLIETRSEPASMISYSKQLCLEEMEDGCTRLHVHFHYLPPGGVIGHMAASTFGLDAKTLLDEMFMRAKHLLEAGHKPQEDARRQARRLQGAGAPEGDGGYFHPPGTREEPAWPSSNPPTTQLAEPRGQFPPAL